MPEGGAPQSIESLAGGAPASADPEVWAPWLGRLLDRQLACYERLDAMSREQSVLIARGDTEGLLSVLGRRQAVLDELLQLNAQAAPVRDRWAALAPTLAERHRAELRRKLESIDRAVAMIAERDETDRAAMERERNAIAQELAGATVARSAINAYRAPAGGGAIYQDRRG